MKNLVCLLSLTMALVPATLATPLCGVLGDGDAYYKKITLPDITECHYACVKEAKCQSSEYRAGDKNCWLYDKPTAQAKLRNEPSGTWIFNDKDCPTPGEFHPRCRSSGVATDSPFAKETVSDGEHSCELGCRTRGTCLAWQYSWMWRECQYFDLPVVKLTIKDLGGQNWILSDRDCLLCDVAGDGEYFYKLIKASTMEECRKQCELDQKCLSCELRQEDSNCWFYDKPVYQAKQWDSSSLRWIFYDRNCPDVHTTVQESVEENDQQKVIPKVSEL